MRRTTFKVCAYFTLHSLLFTLCVAHAAPTLQSLTAAYSDATTRPVPLTPAVLAAVSQALPSTQPTIPATQPASGYVYAPATPALPTTFPAGWTVRIAGKVPKGYGVYSVSHTAAQAFSNQYVSGFDQNGCTENYAGGLSLSGIVSVNALRDPANEYAGQGWYFRNIKGPISVLDSCFAWNGWQTGGAATERGRYAHGNYFNAPDSPPSISHTIYASNSACGVQTRVGGSIDACTFADNGIGVLVVMGRTTISNCDFLGGRLYWTGSAWAGGTAINTYWPLKLINCRFIVMPGQGTAPADGPAGAKAFAAGMICSGGTWANGGEPPWVAPPKGEPLIQATNCSIYAPPAGWPGGYFTGASPAAPAGQLPHGFSVHPPIEFDPTPIVNDVIAGKLSAAAGQAQIAAAISSLATGH